MSETITLELPEKISGFLQRNSKATKQPIEKILLNALQTSFPSLDGLSDEFVENLTSLENLTDTKLRQVLKEKVSANTQTKISSLLKKQQEKSLSDAESRRLETSQNEADLIMLRKARAAVILRFRGQRIPILAELEQTQ
ncbi:MAG: hypothetical protein M3405_03875 [Acidobacteriota bacterium]|nr:hypothetical protein [Acidobacteriota bacterium]